MVKIMMSVFVLIALVAAVIVFQNTRVPELGVKDGGRLMPLSSRPNGVSTQAETVSKKVEPLSFKESDLQTIEAIEKVLAQYGGAKIIKKTDEYLYVVFTTPVMHFHDDAEFLLDKENKAVHFRSQSRAGYSDLGLNKKRYEKLSEIYSQF